MSGKYGGGGVPCTICQKSVYPAELTSFEKNKYHLECFKCHNCKKKLKPTSTCVDKETGILYDKYCFQKLGFANKTVKVSWTKKSGSSTGGSGKGSGKYGGGSIKCAICGKTSYPAETVMVNKVPYHRKCLKCKNCDRKLSTASDCQTFKHEGDTQQSVYCQKCFKTLRLNAEQAKVKWHKGQHAGSSKGSGKWGGGGKPCTKCGKTVHVGEQVKFEGGIYHPACFTCKQCHKKLNTSEAKLFKLKVAGKEDFYMNIYCDKHWKSNGLSALQSQSASKKWTKSTTSGGTGSKKYGGGGAKCHVCGKTVYAAEQISYDKKVYHAKCLKCTDCGTLIKNVSKIKIFEDKLKCSKCWKDKQYAMKQAKVKSHKSDDKKKKKVDKRFKQFGGGGTKCVMCGKTVYPAETIMFEKQPYHSGCFKCLNCGRKLSTGNATYRKLPDGSIKVYCQKCFNELGLNRAKVEAHHDAPQAEVVEPEEAVEEPAPAAQESERTTLD